MTVWKYLPKYSNLRNGSNLGKVKNLRVLQKDSSGRNTVLVIDTTTGSYKVKKDKIRWALRRPGTDKILRSSMFDLDIKRNSNLVTKVTARGKGNGHGVGMCQWGAMEMAKNGYHFEKILSHYYPGIKLQQMYGH